MNIRLLLIACLTGFFTVAAVFGQTSESVKDYLNVSGPIKFDNEEYNLAWSSHPAAGFYKQEYVTAGDNVEKFKKMIMLDFMKGRTNVKEIVDAKASELERIKKSNPIVNYELTENNDEYILDFLLTASSSDGKSLSIAERNVYRYKVITDKSGNSGILLFGVSERSYDSDIESFLEKLQTNRSDLVKEVIKFEIPEIKVTD